MFCNQNESFFSNADNFSGPQDLTGAGEVDKQMPNDLREFVDDDNVKFATEIREWDSEVKRRALQQAAAASGDAGTSTGENQGKNKTGDVLTCLKAQYKL